MDSLIIVGERENEELAEAQLSMQIVEHFDPIINELNPLKFC